MDTPINQIDFLPTLLSLTGLDAYKGDGIDLSPVLSSAGEIPDRDLFWHYPHYANSGGKPGSVIRSGDYKLIHFYDDDRLELYNLRTDPGETTNIAEQQPGRVTEMRGKLAAWLQETGAVIPQRR